MFVWNNWLRYSNPTVCNVMFDTQASRHQYDKLNSTVSRQQGLFYLTASAFHGLAFMYLSYFFRFRRMGPLPILAIAYGYHTAFEQVNDILYSVIVDKEILSQARSLGLERHAQPAGQVKNRGLNFI